MLASSSSMGAGGDRCHKDACPRRFSVWLGVGTRVVDQHIAFHDIGTAFAPHAQPISEAGVLAADGKGYVYLESGWTGMSVVDILCAPAAVKHGAGGRPPVRRGSRLEGLRVAAVVRPA